MATEKIVDVTASFNANNAHVQDIGGWDYVVVQLVSPSTTVNFESTNDGGAITGVIDSGSPSATNFVSTQGTNLTAGTSITSIAASGLVRFSNVGQYLKISGSSVTATKILLRLYKIN